MALSTHAPRAKWIVQLLQWLECDVLIPPASIDGMVRQPEELALRAQLGTTEVDGIRGLWWHSVGSTKTVFLVHHGLGEHAGRYQALADLLGELPLHVLSYDVQGHGASQARRGDGGNLQDQSARLGALIGTALEVTRAEQVVLFGHSMGGAVVGEYLTSRPVDPRVVGAIFSAPALEVKMTLSIRIKSVAARILGRLFPHWTLANSIAADAISSVPKEVRRYLEDPMIHDRISCELGSSLLHDAPRVVTRAAAIKVPTFVYQGSADSLVLRSGIEKLHAGIDCQEKTIAVLAGARHECHHETDGVRMQLKRMLTSFLVPILGERPFPPSDAFGDQGEGGAGGASPQLDASGNLR